MEQDSGKATPTRMTLRLALHARIYHDDPSGDGMPPYAIVTLDNRFLHKPVRLFFADARVRKKDGKFAEIGTGGGSNGIDLHFVNVRLDPTSPYFENEQERASAAAAASRSDSIIVPMDACVMVYLFGVDRDDLNVPCYTQQAAARFRLCDVANGLSQKQPLLGQEGRHLGSASVALLEEAVVSSAFLEQLHAGETRYARIGSKMSEGRADAPLLRRTTPIVWKDFYAASDEHLPPGNGDVIVGSNIGASSLRVGAAVAAPVASKSYLYEMANNLFQWRQQSLQKTAADAAVSVTNSSAREALIPQYDWSYRSVSIGKRASASASAAHQPLPPAEASSYSRERQSRDQQVAQQRAARCTRWFRGSFDPSKYSLADRIQCFFNFNVFERRTPASFILFQTPPSEYLFFANLFYYAMWRHQLRAQRAEPGKHYSMAAATLEYERLPFDERLVVLAFMMTMTANSFNYVTDHLRSEDGRIVYDEDFNDPNEERSGDCEVDNLALTTQDFSKSILLLCQAFAECEDIEAAYNARASPIDPVVECLRELQLMLRVYVPLMCLDRVSTGNASDTNFSKNLEHGNVKDAAELMDDAQQVSAHMNVMLVPMRYFLDRVRLLAEGITADGGAVFNQKHDVYTAADMRLLETCVSAERQALTKNLEKLREFWQRRAVDREATQAMRSQASSLASRCTYDLHVKADAGGLFRMLTLEGTGIYSPLDVANPLAEQYNYVKSSRKAVLRHMADVIHHPPQDGVQFFLNVNTVTTTLFLRKYNLPLCTFIATKYEPNGAFEHVELAAPGSGGSKRVLCARSRDASGRSAVYSVYFRDMAYLRDSVRFVAEPFMNRQELRATRRQCVMSKPLPQFTVKPGKQDLVFYREQVHGGSAGPTGALRPIHKFMTSEVFEPSALEYEVLPATVATHKPDMVAYGAKQFERRASHQATAADDRTAEYASTPGMVLKLGDGDTLVALPILLNVHSNRWDYVDPVAAMSLHDTGALPLAAVRQQDEPGSGNGSISSARIATPKDRIITVEQGMAARAAERLSEIRNAAYSRVLKSRMQKQAAASKTYNLVFVVNPITTVKADFGDGLVDLIQSCPRVVGFDYHVEMLLDRVSNAVITLSLAQ